MKGAATAKKNFGIDAFRNRFRDGARGYLFYMTPVFPTISGLATDNSDYAYLVRSTEVPASSLQDINVNWQGHKYKIAGTQNFSDWTVSFTCDVDAKLHDNYYTWVNLIHNGQTNVHGDPGAYMVDQTVQMLDGTGTQFVLAYELYGMWPSSVGQIRLDYGSIDVATFDVTFKYQFHKSISNLTNRNS